MKNPLIIIAITLAVVFFLYLTPIYAQDLIANRTDTTGFSENNSIRNLQNPVLKMEENPLANMSNPIENLSNPLINMSNPIENLSNPIANITK